MKLDYAKPHNPRQGNLKPMATRRRTDREPDYNEFDVLDAALVYIAFLALVAVLFWTW